MFESLFEKIGKFSSRNSGKIIIFWIIFLVLMLPGAQLVFSNTSFDIGNSLNTTSSMSYKASQELSEYFGQNTSNFGTSNSNASSFIIVTNNTPLQNLKTYQELYSVNTKLSSYSSTIKGFSSMNSIISTQESILKGFSKGMKPLISNATILMTNFNNVSTIYNSTAQLTLGLPAFYLGVYSKTDGNKSISYEKTIGLAQNSSFRQLSTTYVNILSGYWNSSADTSPNFVKTMNLAINKTLGNVTFVNFVSSAKELKQTYYLMGSIDQNVTLSSYINSPKGSILNYTINLISLQFSANKAESYFITDVLGVTIPYLVGLSFNLSQPAITQQIQGVTTQLVVNAAYREFYGNPVISINKNAITGFIQYLTNVSSLEAYNAYIYNYTIFQQPVMPSQYAMSQLVGIGYSTTLIVININQSYNTTNCNEITSISGTIQKNVSNSSVIVTGSETLNGQINNEVTTGLVEALGIGIFLSILIVGLYFRSIKAAFMPLLIFIFSAMISLGLNGFLYKYVLHTQLSFITPTLLLLLLLGLTSDYVVYIMARYRKELAEGQEHPTVVSSRWAGHAVFTSGVTVVISYIVLWLSHVPIFSDSGLTNAIGVTTSIILANTLLLAILHRYGRKILNIKDGKEYKGTPGQNLMTKVGQFSTGKKNTLIIIFIVVSISALTFYFITPTNMDIFKLIPQSSGVQSTEAVNASFGGDFFDRSFIVVHFAQPLIYANGSFNLAEMQKLSMIENTTAHMSGIQGIFGPTYPYGNFISLSSMQSYPGSTAQMYLNQSRSFIGANSKYAEIVFETSSLAWTTPASVTVSNLNNALSANTSNLGYTYNIGGLTEGFSNAYTITASSFSEMIPILAIAIFIILLIQLSSVLTPVRLIIMVMASVIMSLSISFILFHYIQHLPLIIFMPMFAFITLLAVGLDYDIFMISRVKEEVIKGKTEKEAIIISVKENGGVIVTLGAVLAVTFGSLYISTLGIIQEIGMSLAIGVLVDTFITWPFFVPAVMLMLKKYNWWPSKIGAGKQ